MQHVRCKIYAPQYSSLLTKSKYSEKNLYGEIFQVKFPVNLADASAKFAINLRKLFWQKESFNQITVKIGAVAGSSASLPVPRKEIFTIF